jgi:hypothetical protein
MVGESPKRFVEAIDHHLGGNPIIERDRGYDLGQILFCTRSSERLRH